MSTPPVPPEALTRKAETAYRRRRSGWLADPAAANADTLAAALHPPSERQVHADFDAAAAWSRSWQHYAGPARVEWATRRWTSYGEQQVPVRAVLGGAAAIAQAAGRSREWRSLCARRDRLLAGWPVEALSAAVGSSVARWEVLSDIDFDRLLAALGWLVAHPSSGLLIRQLPVPGVDTKWIGRHRGLLETLLEAIRGDRELGVRTLPRLCRIAVCDRELLPGMPRIFASALDELAALPLRPAQTLILENQEGLHALPAMAGTVALHGSGYAVHELAALRWVAESEVLYWGDLDTHGFAILGRLRAHLPTVRSVLMDTETLAAWRDLAVTEDSPTAVESALLTDAERTTLAALREGNLRLEQERIPWPWVMQKLDRPSESDDLSSGRRR